MSNRRLFAARSSLTSLRFFSARRIWPLRRPVFLRQRLLARLEDPVRRAGQPGNERGGAPVSCLLPRRQNPDQHKREADPGGEFLSAGGKAVSLCRAGGRCVAG